MFGGRFQVAAVGLILAGAATYLFLFDPAKGAFYPSCPFLMITGFQCPGCGTARSLHQLLHGHPVTAFELNPLVVTLLPVLILLLLHLGLSSEKRALSLTPASGWVLVVLVVGFWIFRNTPLYPFPV